MQPRDEAPELCSILLVDDQELFRRLARVLLSSHPGLKVVGEAGTGEEALSLVASLKPQAVVLDVQLPDMSGFEAAWRMLDAHPELKVIITSGYDFQYSALAKSVGAAGFLAKRKFSAEAVARALGLGSTSDSAAGAER